MRNLTHISTRSVMARREALKAAGLTMALPLLESMSPVFGKAALEEVPRRMVAIETNMGIMPQFFFPENAGKDYVATPYLERVKDHRDNLTIFSGVSLPGVTGGHAAEKCFLTGTPHPERGGFRNGVSIDQVAAEHIGNRTRFPSLVLAMSNEGGRTLSYTRSGAPILADYKPRAVFQRLFVQGKPEEVEANKEALRQGRSMLDFLGEQTRRLNSVVSTGDRARLDQYFTSVRELERRLHGAQEWEDRPKPTVKARPPEDNDDAREFVLRTKLTLDVVRLALETDSTRLVTLFVDTVVIHNITHHGNRPEVVSELREKEEAQLDVLNGFLNGLRATGEGGQSLLDRTMVLYGTCMGSANSHSNVNLPVLLAGGGFRHGQHLAFDTKANYPLTNLYLTMLHRLGVEVGEFSTSRGTMRGLEMVS